MPRLTANIAAARNPAGGPGWVQLGRPCHRRVYGAACDPVGGPAGLSWAVHATDVSMARGGPGRGQTVWMVHPVTQQVSAGGD